MRVGRTIQVDDSVNDEGSDASSGAFSFYSYRTVSIPALLVIKVCLGALGGFQRIWPLAMFNVGRAGAEVTATALALRAVGGSAAALAVVGPVLAASAFLGAVCGVVLVGTLRPAGSAHRVRLFGCAAVGSGGSSGPSAAGSASCCGVGVEVGAVQFFRDARDTIIRSLCLQASVWSLAVCAASLGTAALAAHQVATCQRTPIPQTVV